MKKSILIVLLIFGFACYGQTPENHYSEQEKQAKQTVLAFFDRFGSQNPEAISQMVTENVDWYIYESPSFPWTGKRHSRHEVAQVFTTPFSYFTPGKESFEVQSFMVDGNQVAVFAKLGREFRKTGKGFSMLVAIHFEVTDAKISKFYLYEQTKVLEAAYLSK